MVAKREIQDRTEGREATRRAAWPVDEAAYQLGVGRTSVYKLAAEGKLKLIKIAGRTLVPDDEIARLIKGGCR